MIDEITYNEIVEAKNDGLNSKDTAEEMELNLEDVNKVYASIDWKDFSGEKTKNTEIITPARAGYYKSLVAKKQEENSNLKENRGWLLEQVSFLRKSVAFLETRKRDLEDGIKNLEKQIRAGIGIMEQLEDNNHFEKLSTKIKKLNE